MFNQVKLEKKMQSSLTVNKKKLSCSPLSSGTFKLLEQLCLYIAGERAENPSPVK